MAATKSAYVINNTNSKRFYFRGITPVDNEKDQQPLIVPLINTSTANTPLFRFSGPKETISFQFALINDGVAVDSADDSGSIRTIQQQTEYLRDEIFTEDFDDDWILYDDLGFYSSGMTGLITNVKINKIGPNHAVGYFAMIRGNIGSI